MSSNQDTLAERLARHREQVLALAAEYGLKNVRVFGSVARGDSNAQDVDLLVEIKPQCKMLDFIAFKQDVEDLLGCKVDLVSTGGISPYMSAEILSEATPL